MRSITYQIIMDKEDLNTKLSWIKSSKEIESTCTMKLTNVKSIIILIPLRILSYKYPLHREGGQILKA